MLDGCIYGSNPNAQRRHSFLTEHRDVEGRPEDVDENHGLVQWDILQSPAERDVIVDYWISLPPITR